MARGSAMGLLHVDTFTFTSFPASQLPCYAIASHRWVEGTEASFEDIQNRQETGKVGYRKIQGFMDFVKKEVPLVKWLWIDTCCIKQQSDRESSMSINSMFSWYREAEVCLAYLEDVPRACDLAAFEDSVWFRRGWTLQELIAPGLVVFLAHDWQIVGHKGHGGCGRSGLSTRSGPSLESPISQITSIPVSVLRDYDRSKDLDLKEKLAWMQGRETTFGEDLSYCLLGILDVSMNIRYGDGEEKTRLRLLKKVSQRATLARSYDMSTTDHFVPRPGDMHRIATYFRRPPGDEQQKIYIVHGTGGMGKTQLCAEYARTHRKDFSAVFWLDGSSKDALHESMANAALRTTGQQSQSTNSTAQASQKELYQSFILWLSIEDNKSWLLIIDNIDRDWQSGAADLQAYDYRTFLPQADHGNVLITTRMQRTQRPRASLNLGRVEDGLAREMVEVRAGKHLHVLEPLLSKLGGLPLALAQAGAYLRTTGMSVPEYVRIYEEAWADLMRSQDRFPLREYTERSVLTTWKLSYEQVKTINPQASALLDLWAFLHSDIWPDLAFKIPEAVNSLGPSADRVHLPMSELSFWDSLSVLVQYSLVDGTTTTSGAVNSIHPVVHSWRLHNIDTGGQGQLLLSIALHLVAAMVQAMSMNAATRDTGLQLANHARTVSARAHKLDANEKAAANLCGLVGFLDGRGAQKDVEMWYMHAFRFLAMAHGTDHHATRASAAPLCAFCLQGANGSEIQEIFVQAIQGFEEGVAANRTSSVDAADLGSLYRMGCRTAEAEVMFVKALHGCLRDWGPEHPSTLRIIEYLNTSYGSLCQMHGGGMRTILEGLHGSEDAYGPT